jgi:hypothetical protein
MGTMSFIYKQRPTTEEYRQNYEEIDWYGKAKEKEDADRAYCDFVAARLPRGKRVPLAQEGN